MVDLHSLEGRIDKIEPGGTVPLEAGVPFAKAVPDSRWGEFHQWKCYFN